MDPDGNRVETQVDSMTAEEANEYLREFCFFFLLAVPFFFLRLDESTFSCSLPALLDDWCVGVGGDGT